jgi:CBS-domain-containing membrane protein
MSSNLRKLVIPAAVVGILLIVVAVIYFAEAKHHHPKHGIAALVVALALFAFAWFQSGPKAQSAPAA